MLSKVRSLAVPVVAAALGSVLIGPAATGSALWSDAATTQRIVEIGRNDNQAMEHLYHLCNEIGQRPAGSIEHHRTAEWAVEKLKEFGLSNAHLEQCGEVPVNREDDWTESFLDKLSRMVRPDDGDGPAQRRVPVYNVVADIPGTEKPGEYVIIGAHYDSVPIGAGALDNGTGVAAVMEAARILVESGARPRRTVRFVLFAGEEAGLIGSRGYVEAHPDLMPRISAMYNMDNGTNFISGIQATQPLKADMEAIFEPVNGLATDMPFEVEQVDWLLKGDPNCCQGGQMTQIGQDGPMVVMHAYKQMPDGTLKRVEVDPAELAGAGCGDIMAGGETSIDEMLAVGDSTARRVIISGGCDPGCGAGGELTVKDLMEMGLVTEGEVTGTGADGTVTKKMKAVAIGSSDQAVFLAAGVPGFWWKQRGDSTVAYPAHTAGDTYERAIPRYLEHSATVIALGALGTANLSHTLSRERLTRPETGPESKGAQAATGNTSL
jgi:hypothetical protein